MENITWQGCDGQRDTNEVLQYAHVGTVATMEIEENIWRCGRKFEVNCDTDFRPSQPISFKLRIQQHPTYRGSTLRMFCLCILPSRTVCDGPRSPTVNFIWMNCIEKLLYFNTEFPVWDQSSTFFIHLCFWFLTGLLLLWVCSDMEMSPPE